tara:strand:- start:4589 stop:4792 length:204 start_codon:yes stop_codon:yes gene_type:complete
LESIAGNWDRWEERSMAGKIDEEVQGFIDYFGDQIPNPDHYPRKVKWLMKWYKYIILENRRKDSAVL